MKLKHITLCAHCGCPIDDTDTPLSDEVAQMIMPSQMANYSRNRGSCCNHIWHVELHGDDHFLND